MSLITKWRPFREMQELEDRLHQLAGRWNLPGNGGKESVVLAEWAPLVDISEDEKEFLVKAELPEVKKDDVKVTVKDDVLHISGERRFEKEEKDKHYHRIERSYGSFERSFTLPENTDSTKLAAEFKDGVLTVHLPKSPDAKPKTVEVKVA